MLAIKKLPLTKYTMPSVFSQFCPFTFIPVIFFLCFSASTFSQDLLPTEIVITAERSPQALRSQIRQAEIDMYEVFNAINDDALFTVSCTREKPLGTKIPTKQTCQPQYYSNATSAEGAAMLQEMRGEASFRGDSGAGLISYYDLQFQEKMKQAIISSPELVEAINALFQLKIELEKKAL